MDRLLLTRRGKLMLAMVVLVAAFVLVLPTMAYAKTLYVSVTGNDANSGLLGYPVKTVQKAVDLAISGDVVEVGAGTFGGVWMTSGVSLYGAGASKTTLSGAGGSVVITANDIGANTTISGFTITGSSGDGINCSASSLAISNDTISGNGVAGVECYDSSPTITHDTLSGSGQWGIHCYGSSSPSITNDTITGNTWEGIRCEDSSSPSITDDTVSGNGDGISCHNSSPSIINDTITRNNTYGIYCSDSSPAITNDTISGNGNGDYSGIICYNSSSPSITNDTISGNSEWGIYCHAPSTPTITNCIVWGDTSGDLFDCSATYSDIMGGAGGTGNISTAPSFVDTATGDFHLKAGSPCIDKGTSVGAPSTDKDGVPRPQGGGFDMGAYEYPAPCPLSYTAGLHGKISGKSPQTVYQHGSGSAVQAVADPGYHFVNWSDGSTANPRTDTNVTKSISVTANFAANPVIATTTKLVAPSSVKVNKVLNLSGTVTPSAAPGTVTITKTRLVGKKWKSAGSVSVGVSSGTFSCSFKPGHKGSWRFVASYSGGKVGLTTYKPSKSGVKGVTVK